MTIKRTNRNFQKKWLNNNKNLKILDLGCTHVNYWKEANHFADIVDYSKEFSEKNLNFTLIYPNEKLPFKDKEFDFVIASHVIEHVEDVKTFIKELERISSKGYIELPTILEDNLVFENRKDHIWHMEFDDINNKFLISEKVQFLEPLITVSLSKKFYKIFRQSLVLELYWHDTIEFELISKKIDKFEKISRLTLLRKFLSKILRNIIRNN